MCSTNTQFRPHTHPRLQMTFCTCKLKYKFIHVWAWGCLLLKNFFFSVWCSCSLCFVYSPAACQCNGHSQCINESVCEKCEDLTTGRHCESCISGFYGDPTNGGSCQREYPRAVQPATKSSSQSCCARLHLTCQCFTVQFYVCHFPDSWLHSKAVPWDIKDLLRSAANADTQSIRQQINRPFLRHLNLAHITTTLYVFWDIFWSFFGDLIPGVPLEYIFKAASLNISILSVLYIPCLCFLFLHQCTQQGHETHVLLDR